MCYWNKKFPDAGILLKCDDNKYTHGYSQNKQAFGALTKYDTLKPYISDQVFRSSNVRVDDVGYDLYVFDIQYQQNFSASQPIKVEFKVDGVVPKDINEYALVLTNNMVSVRGDGRRYFDLF